MLHLKQRGRYIFILILIALVSLIGLQMVWLLFAYRYQAQDLKDKTREAALATTERLQKEEDSRLILTSIDSLLVHDSVIAPGEKSQIKIIVDNLKEKVSVTGLNGEKHKAGRITVTSDTSVSTTVVNVQGGRRKKITVTSEVRKGSFVKKKADELEGLFLKMAMEGAGKTKQVMNRIDYGHLKPILSDELRRRGIDLVPQIAIISGTNHKLSSHPAYVSLPLFPGDFIRNDYRLELAYASTGSFLIRQMTGLLAVSLVFTLFIGFIIIYIFRRMMSQDKLHTLKNDFINNMTHELKTPIATISLAIDAINNPQVKQDEDKFENYTRILKEENRKLNSHVERVLQMALLDKGELQLHQQPVNIIALLNTTLAAYELQIRNRNANVILHGPGEVPVMADAFHLGNAFSNLLDNALKYSHDPCEIIISVTEQANDVSICFKDNGIGMHESEQQKAFDKFYRAQGGNLHDVKGFGLGLSYVKSIVASHGGSISLNSEKNRGSEFIIHLKKHAG
ncbi:MAG: sensor histidine kinase [Bacteroidia bacterium]